jgi:enoyl-CoA hydratase
VLHTDHDHGVATLRLDHGPVNALDLEFLEAIAAEVRRLDADQDTRAIVITGNDRAFSAGVDLRRLLDGGDDYTRPFLAALSEAFLAVFRASTPTVAAVNGHAIAGGAILAAACDHVEATDDPKARIGLSELQVGVPFPTAAIAIVGRRLGARLGRATWLAEIHAPETARELGFVDEVVAADDLLDRARTVARQLGGIPEVTRKILREQLHTDAEALLATRGADWDARVADAWCSDPVRAQIADFMERTLRR